MKVLIFGGLTVANQLLEKTVNTGNSRNDYPSEKNEFLRDSCRKSKVIEIFKDESFDLIRHNLEYTLIHTLMAFVYQKGGNCRLLNITMNMHTAEAAHENETKTHRA